MNKDIKNYRLSTKDLMELYGVTIGTIYNWLRKGLPHIKIEISGQYRFNADEVKEWLLSNKK